MATEALKKFVEELKAARESTSVSLQQIANRTKIDLKFLQAIEEANFEILPELYIRAFIKSYAQIIDLDPKEVLKNFDIAKSGATQETIQPQEKSEGGTISTLKKEYEFTETSSVLENTTTVKQPKNLKLNYIIGGIFLLIALIVVYFAFIKGSSPDIIQEKSYQEAVDPSKPRFEVQNQTQNSNQTQSPTNVTQTETSVPPKPDSLRLVVETSAHVWVKISTDGKIAQAQTVESNTKLKFAATKSFSVSVGNAGVVKLFFNNKPVENVGKFGEIRNIFITPDNIRYLTIAPPSKNETKSSKKN